MTNQTTVIEGLHKQFNSIRSSKSKWIDIVVKSGEAFTSIAYNLIREFASFRSDKPEDLWSIDLVYLFIFYCFFTESLFSYF